MAPAATAHVPRRIALALLVLVFVSGCSHRLAPPDAVAKQLDRMRSEVSTLVTDPVRRAAILLTIDGLQADVLAMRETYQSTLEELRKANARPDASREELQRALDELDGKRAAARQRVVDRHFELTGQTFAAEWSALAGLERKALQAAAQ